MVYPEVVYVLSGDHIYFIIPPAVKIRKDGKLVQLPGGERREVFFSYSGQMPLDLLWTMFSIRTLALKSLAFTVPMGRLSSLAISS